MKAKGFVGGLLCSLLMCGCKTDQPQLGGPLPNLTQEQRAQFEAGKKVFQRVFEPKDGLGPLFNSVACAECHEDPVTGGTGDEIEVHVARFFGGVCDQLSEEGGPVIQQDATPLLRALGILKEEIPTNATAVAHRSTPPVFGFGLVDCIPEATVLAYADPNDKNGDGISGRASRTIDGRVGRFGRKAAVATLFEFNAGAFPFEQGITTPFSPVEQTINGKPVPPETDPAPDPEISLEDIQKLDAFVRYLAPPARPTLVSYEDKSLAKRGEELFGTLKCSGCHIPKMKTGPNSIKALDRQTVELYSDLLVHDMGPELADICLGGTEPSEFRTELLMGLRLRGHYLHDGSAKSIQEAIERHGGEASHSRDKFKALGDPDKKALLKFLQTL
jgi:CxxC motif-containing protein (DUF1111 family)